MFDLKYWSTWERGKKVSEIKVSLLETHIYIISNISSRSSGIWQTSEFLTDVSGLSLGAEWSTQHSPLIFSCVCVRVGRGWPTYLPTTPPAHLLFITQTVITHLLLQHKSPAPISSASRSTSFWSISCLALRDTSIHPSSQSSSHPSSASSSSSSFLSLICWRSLLSAHSARFPLMLN